MIVATGCQLFTDVEGYSWYSDTGSGTSAEYGTTSDNVSDSETDTVTATNNPPDSESETDTHGSSQTNTESDSGTGTDAEKISGTDTDQDTAVTSCESGTFSACYANAIWCFDTKDTPISQLVQCGENEHCDAGPPIRCVCEKYSQCYGGDVWQYSVCTGIDKIAHNCDDTCEKCVDIDDATAQCQPVEVESYQHCGEDGQVHWFDSCGREGSLVTTCESCKVCQNVDNLSARCVAAPDFSRCNLVTSPDRDYDICVSGTCVSPGCGTADCNVPGPYFLLPDSGQRTCWDESNVLISCPSSGEEFFGQDAQFGWDVAHGVDERYTRELNIENEPIVVDNVTGLIWQGCTGGLNGDDCRNGETTMMRWAEAFAYCEKLEWGGKTDWRLPDEYALQTIVDYGTSEPSIHETVFPYTENSYYWASSSNALHESLGEAVYFIAGDVYYPEKTWGYFVRCMRSDGEFLRTLVRSTAPGEPTVTDTLNQLMWQGCSEGYTGLDCTTGSGLTGWTWRGALSFCEDLSWAGYDDWRLPNVVELYSIVNNHVYSPSIDATVFPRTGSDTYWTSTSTLAYEKQAYYVNFDSGFVGSADKYSLDSYSYIRCVRDIE